jgi:hypothetical protein
LKGASTALECGIERHDPRPQKITFGEMRSGGEPTGILVYCADYRRSHSIEMSADRWPDDVRPSDIEPRVVCKACGERGADVRPHFEPARMGTTR